MRTAKFLSLMQLFALCAFLTSCQRSSYDVWEDTKTCGRHVSRGVGSLGGKQGDSRAVCDRNAFYSPNQEVCYGDPVGQDFVPLQDDRMESRSNMSMVELTTPQPRETPGDPGSSIPGIEAFQDPSTNPKLARIFKNVHFEYNKHLVQGDENIEIVHKVADYLRSNPRTCVFVEGHCDERGPEAYNLALGSRRAHSVRNMLIAEGVNPDNIFTISYGKERPLILDHHEESWSENRRAEFKVFQR